MVLAHHHATGGDQGRGGETELVGTEQRADDDIRARCATRHRPAPRCGRADRCAPASAGSRRGRSPTASRRWVRRGQRARAGAALVAGDRHMVGARLRDARRDGADPDLEHQLDRHRSLRVGVLQIGGSAAPGLRSNRCRDAAAANEDRHPVSNAGYGDRLVDLVAGKRAAALARLGAPLRHLDLQHVGVDGKYWSATPNRPDATCLIAERMESPLGIRL